VAAVVVIGMPQASTRGPGADAGRDRIAQLLDQGAGAAAVAHGGDAAGQAATGVLGSVRDQPNVVRLHVLG
jgi:hypothetical protein